MQFKGHLLLPGDDGPGLSVNLDVAEHHLAVESDGGGLGAWPLEAVDVKRLDGGIFALSVAGEHLHFVADDTIGFAYAAVPTIERVSPRARARSGLRSFLDRIWSGPDESLFPSSDPAEVPAFDPRHSEEIERELLTSPTLDETGEERSDAAVGPGVEPEEPLMEIPFIGTEVASTEPVDEVSETRCPAVRSDGRRCESPILTSSGYCYPHDPKRAFDDKYRSAQEARAQIRREATGRLNRIYGRLEKALRQVERGELDPETAMAMAQLARTMCAILGVEPPSDSKDHT